MIFTHLARRLPREFKSNLFRYLSLFFILALGIYLVASFSVSYDTMVVMTERTAEEYKVEDGNFSLFFALTPEQENKIAASGVTLEDQTYMDLPLKSVSNDCVLRVMRVRNKVNKVAIDSGRLPENNGEVVLEKNFAKEHNYKIGSEVDLGSGKATVVGLGVVPDYNLVLRNLSDSAADPEHFGLAFFTDGDFIAMREAEIAPVSYNYSFLLGKSSYDKLRSTIVGFEFDYEKVDDEYFLEAVNLRIADQRKMLDALDELSKGMATYTDGVGKFYDGIEEISGHIDQYTDRIDALLPVIDSVETTVDKAFNDSLESTNGLLQDYGYDVTVTEDNYSETLDALIASETDENRKATLVQSKRLLDMSNTANAFAAIYLQSIRSIIGSIGGSEEEQAAGVQSIKDSLAMAQESVEAMYSGAIELQESTLQIKEGAEAALKKQVNASVSNLTNFLKRADNPRIMSSRNRAASYRTFIWIMGVILLILVSYVLSVFVVQQLNREVKTIGALYALGLTRKELTAHYVTLPTIITTLGSIIGMILAVTPLRVDAYSIMAKACSVLSPKMVILPYIVIACIVMPIIISVIVNLLSIGRQLDKPALALLNNSVEKTTRAAKKPKKLRLAPKLDFVRMFQLRQLARESRTGSTIIFGIFNCILVIMLGLSMHFFSFNLIRNTNRDLSYEYMYALKYPTEQLMVEAKAEGAEAIFQKVLNVTSAGKTANINIIGIEEDATFFPAKCEKGYNKLTVSSALANKYYLKKGSTIIMSDAGEQHDYVFYVSDIVDYNVGVCAFMDIDSMRELFNMPADHYNILVSNKALDIEEGRIYSVITKAQIMTTAAQMRKQVQSMVFMAVAVGFLIMVLVMYILTSVMIERAAVGVSLTRIFGYSEKEVRRLYLNGNYIIVGVGASLAVPISILISRWLVNFATLNFNIGVNIFMPWWAYFVFFGIVMLSYTAVSAIVQRKLKKIPLTEALKSRG